MKELIELEILQIQSEYGEIRAFFDERRRLWCAARSRTFDRMYQRGGVSAVSQATGVSRPTIYAGLTELQETERLDVSRIRKSGGGRKSVETHYPDILSKLEDLVDPDSRGDPESPLRWTTKSTRKLSDELKQQGYKLGSSKVRHLLLDLNYTLQSNKKTMEGGNPPDRDEQFQYINEQAKRFHSEAQPVISVDTKKKENIGEFKNPGQQ
ncbi:MAG: ISAzo13 family transposase [SAR324 cluster bacterium]|nr:ISAzo13 family transposase [SAR324 cluster bacterium]